MNHRHTDWVLIRSGPAIRRITSSRVSYLPIILPFQAENVVSLPFKATNNNSTSFRSFASTKKKNPREVPWRVRPPMISRDEGQTRPSTIQKDVTREAKKMDVETFEKVKRAEGGVPSMLRYDHVARTEATSQDKFLSLLAADGPVSELNPHSQGPVDEYQQDSQHSTNDVVEVPRYKRKAYDYSEHRISHDFDFPPSWFNSDMSTEQNYGIEQNSASMTHRKAIKCCGEFVKTRQALDYKFHNHYISERQLFQDQIIGHKLDDPVVTDLHGMTCARPENPWLVFTAGAYGAGKSYTINTLVDKDRFPLSAFVKVDPDEIRRMLPEFEIYVNKASTCEIAGELTRKEAGYMCEILTAEALKDGKNVLVDGSLRDREWYKRYLGALREDFPFLRIAILHVTAPWEAVLERVAKRAQETGRVVPLPTLERAFKDVPESVRELAPLVDYVCELQNGDNGIEIVTPGETWQKFKSKWYQICAEWY